MLAFAECEGNKDLTFVVVYMSVGDRSVQVMFGLHAEFSSHVLTQTDFDFCSLLKIFELALRAPPFP